MKKIAVPLSNEAFCSHFGGADAFAIYEVNEASRTVHSKKLESPPKHGRGIYPVWLRKLGTQTVLAGGMGGMAAQLFAQFGIETIIGVEGANPDDLLSAYLDGRLETKGEVCHEHGHHNCGNHSQK